MMRQLERALLALAVVPSLVFYGCGSGGAASGEDAKKGSTGKFTEVAANLSTTGSHTGGPVYLRAKDGSFIADNSKVYSPEKTCGGCHDVDAISAGYHFQQGRLAMTSLSNKDGYNTSKPWLLSDGMYGKW